MGATVRGLETPLTRFLMTSQPLLPRKRRGPLPTGQGFVVGVRIHPELLRELDHWMAAQPQQYANRSEAIRSILRERISERGAGDEVRGDAD